MSHKITLIPGDGIGTEVTTAVVRILEATGLKFEWETVLAGADAYEKYKEYIPKELTARCFLQLLQCIQFPYEMSILRPRQRQGGGFAREQRSRFDPASARVPKM